MGHYQQVNSIARNVQNAPAYNVHPDGDQKALGGTQVLSLDDAFQSARDVRLARIEPYFA